MAKPRRKRRRQRGTGGVQPGGNNGSGGSTSGPSYGQSSLPPYFSYDPQYYAEIESLGRGLKDILKDTNRARRFNRQDFGTARKDFQFQVGDIETAKARGLRDLGAQRQNIELDAKRGREDFQERLTGLIRNFQIQGREQRENANAAGVHAGSTGQAAAFRRNENLAFARRPIDIGMQRLEEDRTRALGRLGIQQGDLLQDASRDYTLARRDLGLARRDFTRTKLDLRTKRRRAIREQRIGKLDLIQSAIFDARQRKPGAFDRYGNKKG
jgi:hypothetical protein